MKKLLLLSITTLGLVACSKSEISQARDTINKMDSTYTTVSNQIKTTDSIVSSVRDSAQIKIERFQKDKDKIQENFKKTIDSTEKILKGYSKIPNQMDSLQKVADEKIKQAKEKSENIIKETKIIYRDKPTAASEPKEPVYKEVLPTVQETNARVSLDVPIVSEAKEQIRNLVNKYDGTLKSEQISINSGIENGYFQIRLPQEKLEYFLSDLENHGTIQQKDIENMYPNSNSVQIVNLSLSIKNQPITKTNNNDDSFSNRSSSAFGKGWNVLQEIFLFVIPFWPIFLIGVIIFYIVRKNKKPKDPTQNPT